MPTALAALPTTLSGNLSSKTYETQSDITAENADEKLTAIADGAGVKGAEIAACAAKPETKAHVDASLALGKAVDVTGTPDPVHQRTQSGQLRSAHVGCLQKSRGVCREDKESRCGRRLSASSKQ